MRRHSLRNTVIMVVGALVCVQGLIVALERQARPGKVDPVFYAEVKEAQYFSAPRYMGTPRGHSARKATHASSLLPQLED